MTDHEIHDDLADDSDFDELTAALHRKKPRTWPQLSAQRLALLALLVLSLLAILPGWWPGRISASSRVVLHDAPWKTFAGRELRSLSIPLWNPYQQGGRPAPLAWVPSAFYPTILLHMFLPPALALAFGAMLRLFAAALGTWFLAGRYGLSIPGRLLSSATFMLCAFNTSHLSGPEMNAVPLLPWLILAVDRLAERVSGKNMALAAALLLIGFVGGSATTGASLLTAALLACIAHFVAGPQRQPAAEPSTAYCHIAAELRHRFSAIWAAIGLLVAAAAALSVLGIFWIPALMDGGLASIRHSRTVAGSLHLLAATLIGWIDVTGTRSAGWIGTVPLVLAAFGLVGNWRTRRALTWLLLAILALLLVAFPPKIALARDSGTIRSTISALLTYVGDPSLLVLTALSFSFLSALGLELLLNRLAATTTFPSAPAPIESQKSKTENSTPCLRASVVNDSLPRAAWACLGLAAVELLLFGWPHIWGTSRTARDASMAALDYLSTRDQPRGAQIRLIASGNLLPPDTATALGLVDLRATSASGPQRMAQWLANVAPRPADSTFPIDVNAPALKLLGLRYLLSPPELPAPGGSWTKVFPGDDPAQRWNDGRAVVYEQRDLLPRAWVARNAQWNPSAAAIFTRLKKPDFDPKQLVLLDRGWGSRAPDPAASSSAAPAPSTAQSIEWLKDSSRCLRMKISSGGGWLVLQDAYDPLWSATIAYRGAARRGGMRTIERPAMVAPAYGIMRAVPLPASSGPLEVTLTYGPPDARVGGMVSIAGGMVMIILLIWPLFPIGGWDRKPDVEELASAPAEPRACERQL